MFMVQVGPERDMQAVKSTYKRTVPLSAQFSELTKPPKSASFDE
jgi:hypothetical protein